MEVKVKEALLTAVVSGASNFGLLDGGAEVVAFRATDCLVTRGVVVATGDIAFGDFFSLEAVSSSASLMLSSSDFITIATALSKIKNKANLINLEVFHQNAIPIPLALPY